jgi:hypothetical protein
MNALSPSGPYQPSPEQFVVLALLSEPRPDAADTLAAAMRQTDWNRLLGMTASSLHPYLHFALQEYGLLQSVPAEALAAFERAKTDAVLRYMRRRKELDTIFRLYHDRGIEVVALKGASLGESVYPMPYLRPMRDVDLWVSETEMERAQSVLESDGYVTKQEPKSLEFDLQGGKEIRLAKFFRHDLSVIELHATLDVHLPEETEEVDAIWARCVDHPVLRAKTLEPRDMLYHLCMHLALRHRFEQGLLWLLDIRLFLEKFRDQVDWVALAEDSRRQHTGKYLYICLEIVADLLGCALPEGALAHLEAPSDLRGVKSLVWRQIWESDFAVLPPRRFLMLATAGSPGKMCVALANRFRKYSTSKSPAGQQPMGLLQKAWSAQDWIVSDLRKAYKAFRNGGFSRENLRRACAMESRRTEFEKSMQS